MEINKTYRLSLHASSILGSGLRSAKLVSILDARTARRISSTNIDVLHKQIFPYLPPEAPNDINRYTFYLFEVNGKEKVIADYWIIPSSIEEDIVADTTLTLKGVSVQDVQIISEQLRLMGIRFEVS